MASGEFEKSNLGWQIQQLQQKISQWWEWQLRQFNLDLPNFDFESPSWRWLESFWAMIKFLSLGLLVVLVIGAIWRIWRLIRPYFYELKQRKLQQYQQLTPRELSLEELLRRSQKYQAQGDYYQACRCLYLAMLQKLDEQGLIPQQISRTDGEYLALILQLPRSEPYETLLHIHEQLCFASQRASPNLLATCQTAYQNIVNNQELEIVDS